MRFLCIIAYAYIGFQILFCLYSFAGWYTYLLTKEFLTCICSASSSTHGLVWKKFELIVLSTVQLTKRLLLAVEIIIDVIKCLLPTLCADVHKIIMKNHELERI